MIQYFKAVLENPKRRNRWAVSLFIATAAFLFLFSDHGIYKRYELERKKSSIIASIKQEEFNRDSLELIIKSLRNDTLEIERIAREKYGMVKPGEEVFRSSNKQTE